MPSPGPRRSDGWTGPVSVNGRVVGEIVTTPIGYTARPVDPNLPFRTFGDGRDAVRYLTSGGHERCVNTGDYNNFRIGAEVEVAEGESGKDALQKLIQFVDNAASTTPRKPAPNN